MLRFSHKSLILFSGLLWLAIGLYLLPLGVHFLTSSTQEGLFPLMSFLGSMTSPENAVILLIASGLYLGYMKGKFVLAKTVNRGVEQVRSLPNPAPLSSVYTPKYLLLVGFMVALGISLKLFSVPLDIRGLIDVAIGAALINGSLLYFRKAFA